MGPGSRHDRVVTVPSAYFRANQLPAVCVLTGRPADTAVSLRAVSGIGAQWLLLLLGILPFILVRVFTAKETRGYLPVSRAGFAEIAEENRPLKVAARATLAAALVATVVVWWSFSALASTRFVSSLPLVPVALFIASWALYGIHGRRTTPGVVLDRSGEFLTITRVSPEFADAAGLLPPAVAVVPVGLA